MRRCRDRETGRACRREEERHGRDKKLGAEKKKATQSLMPIS
jgi:hypothetical protein